MINLTPFELAAIIKGIQAVRDDIRWKANSAERHLQKCFEFSFCANLIFHKLAPKISLQAQYQGNLQDINP